eukprot:scaffold78564_cov20-Tisochrysis_lutea.AAC.1
MASSGPPECCAGTLAHWGAVAAVAVVGAGAGAAAEEAAHYPCHKYCLPETLSTLPSGSAAGADPAAAAVAVEYPQSWIPCHLGAEEPLPTLAASHSAAAAAAAAAVPLDDAAPLDAAAAAAAAAAAGDWQAECEGFPRRNDARLLCQGVEWECKAPGVGTCNILQTLEST